MNKILITETLHTREDFFHALGGIRGCDRPAPANLDDMADFLREARISAIIAAAMEMDLTDFAAIAQVLEDLGIRLLR